jgi:MFS transporter, DHA1 family, inner membrane transport protein
LSNTYTLSPGRERGLLWLLALTQFTVIMDFMVMMPLGPQIMSAFEITPALFALAVSAYSWCSAVSGLFAATYIDRFDRRKLLLTVYALFTLSNLGCALAPTYEWMLLSRAFAGLTGGVLASIVMTIVSDIIPASRRGAATGVIMTSFSLAAVAGVPIGILLGAHWGWSSAFYLLVVLSLLIWAAGASLLPSLRAHLDKAVVPLSQVLPDLWRLLSHPMHLRAYALTFTMMVAHMMVIPFISPTLVANLGISPKDISWIYMAGGAATFFSARWVGKLADRHGKHRIFRIFAVLSILAVLTVTHLHEEPFGLTVAIFVLFMVSVSSRMIPLQALLSTVPVAEHRGAFLSVNTAIQAFGNGCGAWLGGLFLSTTATGHIQGYGINGWASTALAVACMLWIGRVRSAASPT